MLPLIVAVVVGGGLLCVLYGVFVERRWFRLRRYRLAILPTEGGRTITLLHLSDLHFVRNDADKARFLASLPETDVTVVTGDFLAEPEAVETAVEAVRATRGRLASWFVLGSNDYFTPRPLNYAAYFRGRRRRRSAALGRPHDLVRLLIADGWEDLTNSRREGALDGLPIELLGLDDAHIRWHDYRPAPRRAPERFGIAVMHSPDSAPEAAALGYELVVAGHTHGGQVRLPLIGALVTNSSMPRRLVSGLIQMGSATLHTSPGLGTSKFAPFRFLCRPEATVLELTPGADAAERAERAAPSR
ncbi:MAG TPA: metallophosphoesterase [Actinomycetota bacterium]|nr:metallophosphoesterase [Actinomycetota bacterium]